MLRIQINASRRPRERPGRSENRFREKLRLRAPMPAVFCAQRRYEAVFTQPGPKGAFAAVQKSVRCWGRSGHGLKARIAILREASSYLVICGTNPLPKGFVGVADEKSTLPSWKGVKAALQSFDRTGLLGLVQDLYAVDRDNQAFLHARLGLGSDQLGPYKAIISRWICPDLMRKQSVSISKAKKTITDYRKAIGHSLRNRAILEISMSPVTETSLRGPKLVHSDRIPNSFFRSVDAWRHGRASCATGGTSP